MAARSDDERFTSESPVPGVRSDTRPGGDDPAPVVPGDTPGDAPSTRTGGDSPVPVVPGDGTTPARMAGAGPSPGAAQGGSDGGVGAAVRDFVRTAVGSVGRAGSVSLSALGDAAEAPGRALAGRIAANAVAQPRPVAERAALVGALSEQPSSPLLGGSTGAAVAAKVAGRIGPLRFLARRTPMWLIVTAVPAMHASVTRGAEELALVASHLVHRVRAAGHEPHPERIRRATVQIVSGAAVDPDVEPRHAPLAVAWLQRALRATLPFSPGVGTRNAGALARAASDVDPSMLAAPPG